MRCQAGQGVMGTRQLTMSIGARQGSVSAGMSHEASMGSAMGKANMAVTGSASVTLHGASMGLAGHSVFGTGRRADEQSTWDSDTSVRCQGAHGIMGSRRATKPSFGTTVRVHQGAGCVD